MFFDGVFVAQDQLIGPLHGGWTVAGSTLSHERGTNPRQLVIHTQLLDELFALAAERGLMSDPSTQQDLAQAFVELRLFQLQNWRSLSRLQHGRELGPEAATAKRPSGSPENSRIPRNADSGAVARGTAERERSEQEREARSSDASNIPILAISKLYWSEMSQRMHRLRHAGSRRRGGAVARGGR